MTEQEGQDLTGAPGRAVRQPTLPFDAAAPAPLPAPAGPPPGPRRPGPAPGHDGSRGPDDVLTVLLEHGGLGVVAEDADGRTVLVNATARRLLDLPDGLDAAPLHHVAGVAGDDELRRAVDLAHRGGAPRPRRLTVDGRTIECTHVPTDRPVARHVWLLRDVTDRHEAVVALRRQTDQTVAAHQSLHRVIARMGHDLRTPLHTVLGLTRYLSMQLTDPVSHGQHEHLDRIYDAGARLLVTLDKLMDLARAEAGELPVDPRPLDLAEIVLSTTELIMARTGGHGRRHLVEPPEPGLTVMADERWLRLVLRVLLDNAVAHTPPEANIRVTVGREGDHACIAVHDDGPGIAAERLGSLFEPFGGGAAAARGSGLSLPLACRVVRLMGGTLDVESRVGVGSTFTCMVPLATVAPVGGRRRVRGGPGRPRRRGTVLLAEDDVVNQRLMVDSLQALGWQVVTVTDGVSVVEQLPEVRPDVVLADLRLPGIGGCELTRRLRSDPAWAGLPVIAIGAMLRASDVAACTAAGCDGWLDKPVTLDELRAVLDQAVPVPDQTVPAVPKGASVPATSRAAGTV